MPLLAHSPRPGKGIPAQSYAEHVRAVTARAYASALSVLKFRRDAVFAEVVRLSACWHDLGKLDPDNQRVLAGTTGASLPVKHEYAGVRYLRDRRHGIAAALIYAHHKGLPNLSRELYDIPPFEDFDETVLARVQARLQELVSNHLTEFPESDNPETAELAWIKEARKRSGMCWRFSLSCLVDGDHFDTAINYGGEIEVKPPEPRWNERIEKLETYVKGLSEKSKATGDRNNLRRAVYEGCRDLIPSHSRYACDSGVGTGKTTAVMAHLLRVARDRNLRHIFVVLPFTNIINQSVETYRAALTLDGEDPESVVAAHHHQVDFESAELRQLATLWDCPITVTTAVQFFQTMATCKPAAIRKLHELPGSAVFIDEAHAALPAWLWPQTWRWIEELTKEWGCHFVFASGSLVRFWEHQDFVRPTQTLPEMLPLSVRSGSEAAERKRLQYTREERRLSFDELTNLVFEKPDSGPHLVVVNTVQTAAELARAMRNERHDVLHLSTALTPNDRDPIIERIKERLNDEADRKWALIATSCVEAGLDFDFRTAFRELSSVTSVIQIGGRVNRSGNYRDGAVIVFSLDDARASQNPALKVSMKVLDRLFANGDMSRLSASELCTKALQLELSDAAREKLTLIHDLEHKKNFPEVAAKYRVIEDETIPVLVEPTLTAFEDGDKLRSVDIVRGSVRLRRAVKDKYAVRQLAATDELFAWTLAYDPHFLGYMDGALATKGILAGDFTLA